MIVLVNGAGGRLGEEVIKEAKAAGNEVVAADKSGRSSEEVTFARLADYRGKADVIVDFSFHTATRELTEYAVERKLPLVIATTGQTEEEKEIIRLAAKEIPVFFSANMSFGVALLTSLVSQAAALLKEDDVEIIEYHHNKKADAPSGTALMIAGAIEEARGGMNRVIGRSGVRKREKGDLGISSVRIGSVVGKHEVMFSDGVETVTITHEAHDKALFARGALRAAAFLMGKAPGLYAMKDLLEDAQ